MSLALWQGLRQWFTCIHATALSTHKGETEADKPTILASSTPHGEDIIAVGDHAPWVWESPAEGGWATHTPSPCSPPLGPQENLSGLHFSSSTLPHRGHFSQLSLTSLPPVLFIENRKEGGRDLFRASGDHSVLCFLFPPRPPPPLPLPPALQSHQSLN